MGPPGPAPHLDDVAWPFKGVDCECEETEADGLLDLILHFRTADLVDALEMDDLPGGALVPLVVSGVLLDGTEFTATDCVWLVPPDR